MLQDACETVFRIELILCKFSNEPLQKVPGLFCNYL